MKPAFGSLPVVGKVLLDRLDVADKPALVAYLLGLRDVSRRVERPHLPSLDTVALFSRPHTPRTFRYVLRLEERIVGYFAFDPMPSEDDARRYLKQLVVLEPGRDFLFTATVADDLQGQGLASCAMPHLIRLALAAGARSLVVPGGVPATQERGLKFLERWGFLRHGGHQLEVFYHDMRLVLDRGGTQRRGTT